MKAIGFLLHIAVLITMLIIEAIAWFAALCMAAGAALIYGVCTGMVKLAEIIKAHRNS